MEEPKTPEDTIDIGSEYEIPLGLEHLQKLGLFTALYSQIDYLLIVLISHLTQAPIDDLTTIVDGTTLGTKLNIFRRLSRNLEWTTAHGQMKELEQKLGSVIEKRNHVIHGIWAQHIILEQKSVKVGCYFNKSSKNTVFPDDLDALITQGASITRLIGNLINFVGPKSDLWYWTEPRRLMVCNDDISEIPEWLQAPFGLLKMGHTTPDRKNLKRPLPPEPTRK